MSTPEGTLLRGPQPEALTTSNIARYLLTCHRQTVVHAGQTYDADTCGLSFITFAVGAVLEDIDAPLPHQKRVGMMTRLFPDRAFGDVAGGDATPLFADISG